MATGSVQSAALSYNEYTHANGARIVCMKSNKTVTIRCTGIGTVSPIAANSSFSFNLGADSKYYPPILVFTYGTYTGDWQGSAAFRYSIDSSGNVTGYAYHNIDNGDFCITFLTA
jgi:hypothetical protein